MYKVWEDISDLKEKNLPEKNNEVKRISKSYWGITDYVETLDGEGSLSCHGRCDPDLSPFGGLTQMAALFTRLLQQTSSTVYELIL